MKITSVLRAWLPLCAAGVLTLVPLSGATLDTLILGNPASEAAHGLIAPLSVASVSEYELTGSGGDIGGTGDQFFFRYQTLTGDGYIQARIMSPGTSDASAQAGVMIRESLDPGARHAVIFNTPSAGLNARWRGAVNGATAQAAYTGAGVAPFWLRVQRAGDVLTMSVSTDASTWSPVSTQTIALGSTVYAGAVVCARNNTRTNSAIFGDISGSATGAWAQADVGAVSVPGTAVPVGLGEPSRRLLPQTPRYYYGGDLVFNVAVDPDAQNYCTLKIWGGENNENRLILNIGDGNGNWFEVGQRHGSGLDVFVENGSGGGEGAFWFRTQLLPRWYTQGKTTVPIRIRSTGRFYGYGTPFVYDTYQYPMTTLSRGLYRFYTHNDPLYTPAVDDTLGTPPNYATAPTRPAPDADAILAQFKTNINARMTSLLAKPTLGDTEMRDLARAYQVAWTNVYQSPAVLPALVKSLDARCRAYHANPASAGAEWGGEYGIDGGVVSLIAASIQPQLEESLDLGQGPGVTRRVQWAAMLQASRDFGRVNRKTITNQVILCDTHVYLANRGLLALGASAAFTETAARRYIYEAAGLLEYSGSDTSVDDPSPTFSMGRGYYMVTTKGTTHENSWTSYDDYGRMAPYIFDLYRWSGDTALRDKAVQMERAHHVYMLYALVDGQGWRAMLNEGVISCRNVFFPGKTSYADHSIAASTFDPLLVGTVKLAIADGQFFNTWQENAQDVYLPDNYAALSAAADPGVRPPQMPGQPNWAWADEQNALLSIHYNNEQHFITFLRRPSGVDHLASAHTITPQSERVVEFWVDDVRYVESGSATTVSFRVQSDFGGIPPDNPVSAFSGRVQPYPLDEYGKASTITQADFYGARYGNFLIGMNCSFGKTFLYAPRGLTSGVDLVSGQTVTGSIMVPPQTTVVIYAPLSGAATSPDVAINPKPVDRGPTWTSIDPGLSWTAGAGATAHRVYLGTTATLTEADFRGEQTATSYTPALLEPGTTYYWRVDEVNAAGVKTGSTWSFTTAASVAGSISREFWSGINGGMIAALTSHANYPNRPTSTSTATTLEGPTNAGDNYGARYRGLLKPTTTGEYTFWVAADDAAELYLSTTNDPANKVLIASTAQGTAVREWSRSPQQRSALITLTAGSSYYIEVLHKEGTAGDHVAVAWQGPGIAQSVIGSASLATWPVPVPAPLPPPTAVPATPTAVAVAPSNTQVRVSWASLAGATTYSVKRAAATGGPYTTIATNVTAAAFVDTGLAQGTAYYYVVSASNALGEGPDSVEAVATTVPLPAPWTSTDVGVVQTVGRASYSGGSFSVKGSGNDISGSGDSFRFAYLPLTGDGTIVARLASRANGGGANDKVGVMMRESLAGNARTTAALIDSSPNQTRFATRAQTGGGLGYSAGVAHALPSWIKLERVGNVFSAYSSVNGSTWTQVGASTTIAMTASPILVGLAVCSRDVALNTSVFDQVSVNGWQPPAAPTGVNAAAVAGQIGVTWTAVPGATRYNVLRSTTSGGPYVLIGGNVTGTTFTDAAITDGGTYYYVVSARYDDFDSPVSAEASAGLPPRPPAGLIAAGWDGRVDLSWSAAVSATSYTVNRATSAAGPYTAVATLSAPVYSDNAVVNGTTYYYSITATNAAGSSSPGEAVAAAPAADPAVTGWSHADIGTVGVAGNAAYANGVYTVHGSGADIWAAADGFHYLYRTLTGDGAIVARVLAQQNTGPWAKAGVMIRASLAANSAHASAVATPGNGISYQRRSTTGSSSFVALPGLAAPYWVKMVRVGDVFTASASPDGVTWTPIGSQTIVMNATVYVGLAVTATSNTVLAQVTFDRVAIATPPTLTSPSSAAGTVDEPFSYTITATQEPTTFWATDLPAGLTLDAPTGVLSGTPTTAGTFGATINAGNAAATATAPLTLTIAPASAAIALGSLQQAYDGTAKPVAMATAPGGLSVTVTYDGATTAPTYPGSYAVAATVTNPNYVGSESGTLTIITTAFVRHAPTVNGDVEGSIQVLLPESLTLNSGAAISGDLLLPGTPAVKVNGQPTFVGTREGPGAAAPATHTVTLNSGSVLRYLVRRIEAPALPVVAAPATPAGTRNVSLNNATASPGDFATLRNLTLNSGAGAHAIPPGVYGAFTANSGSRLVLGTAGALQPAVYELQGLTLNSGAQLQVVGPVVLTVAGAVTLNADAGAPAHPEWLTLRVAAGGVTVNSGADFAGHVIAPSGTVTINGAATLTGRVTSDRLTLNSDAVLSAP